MNFLAPAALLGLLGLGLPVVAHLLGREKPERVPFAALRFVEAAEPVVSQRRSLRDRPLLLVRLLFLAVLVLVLARPAFRSQAAVAVLAEPHDAVIVLDASASMGLRVDGHSEAERGLERVETLLEALPPGSRVGLVLSDPRGGEVDLRPIAEGAGAVRGALDAWTTSARGGPRPGAWSLAGALPRATAMLDEDRDLPRVIYAVGDSTERGLGSLPATVGGAITVIPVPTRGQAGEDAPPSPGHVGIAELGWEAAPELDPRAVRVRALVQHYGQREGELGADVELGAALDIGEETVASTRVSLRAGDRTVVEFTHILAKGDSALNTRARVRLTDLEGDALSVDDRRHVWLEARDDVEILVVNGDPSETRSNDEIFFLSTALGRSELGDRIEVRGLALDQLEERLRRDPKAALASVDLLILANVRAPAAELAPLIVEAVEEGMGLWITGGDRVSAADYNASFEAVLPLLLREAVYAGTAPGRTEARSEALAPVQLSHPIFAGLRGDGAAADFGGDLDLSATRTQRMFLLEPDPSRGADIAVAFSSGAPALITSTHGRGRVAMLATTVDRDWGDLPLRPGFVPLVTRTVRWLAGTQEGSSGDEIGVGVAKTLARSVPYAVTTPDGRVIPVTPREGEPAVFEDTDVPGHYRATPRTSGEEPKGASAEAGVDASAADTSDDERFVVSVDARESETVAVSVAAVAPAQDAGARGGLVVIYEPRWRELALLMLALLGLESLLRLRKKR